jgi:hypothetical protein
MRDTLADFASRAQMQPEREPSLLGFKGAQGKALKADLRVVEEGQLRYYDATVVSMYRKDVRMNKSALALDITSKEVQSDQCPERTHESHAASYGCGGRWEARIVTWRGSPTASATGYRGCLPMGTLNWAIGTGPMYVRAAVVTRVLRPGTCAQPSRPESGCTACPRAVKSILIIRA